MEEASEEQPSLCYSSRGIRWSSNILIGSIPLKKKKLVFLDYFDVWLGATGQFHLFTPSLSHSPCLNILTKQLNYSKQH